MARMTTSLRVDEKQFRKFQALMRVRGYTVSRWLREHIEIELKEFENNT